VDAVRRGATPATAAEVGASLTCARVVGALPAAAVDTGPQSGLPHATQEPGERKKKRGWVACARLPFYFFKNKSAQTYFHDLVDS
jgi:hypothetical protein